MAQGARSSSFTMNELGVITFGAIPSPNSEPSLLDTTPQRNQDMIFYINDLFSTHDSDEAEVMFLEEHFFPRLLWSKLKLGFNKLELVVTEVLALGKLHYAGGRINLKLE